MTFRGQHVTRCERCRMEQRRCLCALVPRLDAKTRVIVLLHVREVERPTNTGRFLPWMLPNASSILRGVPREEPAPLPDTGGRPHLVLHPAASRELTREDAARDPVLLVPDATWSQSRRMLGRDPDLREATRVRLPAGAPGRYRLRETPHESQLSTLEAVARAVGVLEGPAYEEAMLSFFDVFVERTLLTRGRLRDDPVLGIVPAGTPRVARERDPMASPDEESA